MKLAIHIFPLSSARLSCLPLLSVREKSGTVPKRSSPSRTPCPGSSRFDPFPSSLQTPVPTTAARINPAVFYAIIFRPCKARSRCQQRPFQHGPLSPGKLLNGIEFISDAEFLDGVRGIPLDAKNDRQLFFFAWLEGLLDQAEALDNIEISFG